MKQNNLIQANLEEVNKIEMKNNLKETDDELKCCTASVYDWTNLGKNGVFVKAMWDTGKYCKHDFTRRAAPYCEKMGCLKNDCKFPKMMILAAEGLNNLGLKSVDAMGSAQVPKGPVCKTISWEDV